jgi:hypothetical protein
VTIKDWLNSKSAVISRVDAATLLDCDPRTIGRGIEEGTIPCISLGSRKVIPLLPLLRLLGLIKSEE